MYVEKSSVRPPGSHVSGPTSSRTPCGPSDIHRRGNLQRRGIAAVVPLNPVQQRNFLFHRQPRQQILHPRLHRLRRIPIGRQLRPIHRHSAATTATAVHSLPIVHCGYCGTRLYPFQIFQPLCRATSPPTSRHLLPATPTSANNTPFCGTPMRNRRPRRLSPHTAPRPCTPPHLI